MKIDGLVKFLLLVIAIFLGVIALRPYVAPRIVEAQSGGAHPIYVEPGAVELYAQNGRNVMGRIVIDLRNGNVWGFPEFLETSPQEFAMSPHVPTSHPVLLGKYALGDLDK